MQVHRIMPVERVCPACNYIFDEAPRGHPHLVTALFVWLCPACDQRFEEVRTGETINVYWSIPAQASPVLALR